MKKSILILMFFCVANAVAQTKFQKDFDFYWLSVNDNFAYFDRQKTNWNEVKTVYQPMLDTVKSRPGMIHFLEIVNNEMHNGHVFLNTNLNSSTRTIPTGSDLKVSYENGHFVISEIRESYNADLSGLKKGMVVVRVNDVPIEIAMKEFLPRTIHQVNNDSYEYAGNMVLAGKHNVKRKITVLENNVQKDYFPDAIPNMTEARAKTSLEQKKLDGNIGYIKINNSLGDTELIKDFDAALDNLMDTDGFIIDLRETPSGGTTTIARAIMGRFTDVERPYQKHVYTNEEKESGVRRSTIELVSPRKTIYKKPLVILVGNWTGSMSEGIAIGFNGMKRASVIGTKMAGLLGEIYSFETPELKIPFSFPCVQLQQINGKPREDFKPDIIVDDPKIMIKTASAIIQSKIIKPNGK